MRKIDLTGKRFGHLTVIKEVGKRGNQIMWQCKCDCGNIKNIMGGNLRNGSSTSCGCSTTNNILNYNKNNTTHLGVTYYKKSNKWRARICINGNNKSLGLFDNIDDAIQARKEAEKKYFKPVLDKYKKQ